MREVDSTCLRASSFLLLLLGITFFCYSESNSQCLEDLSDEFDNPATLSEWRRYFQVENWPDKMDSMDVDHTLPGALFLEPTASGWFNDRNAFFMFKVVAGDFSVETRLRVTGKSTITPQATYSLCGPFVRAPRNITSATWTPGGENWLFITTGAGGTLNGPYFEDKTTINSSSTLRLISADTGWMELRIDRTGAQFDLYYRLPGGSWVLHQQFNRPDMPDTLQVGLTAYTDWDAVSSFPGTEYDYNLSVIEGGNPDLYGYVDYYRFFGGECSPPGCCVVPGDADHSSAFNIGDVTFGIARIFAGGQAPVCFDEADANTDGSYNISDVTFGIAHIFSGGPAPMCP